MQSFDKVSPFFLKPQSYLRQARSEKHSESHSHGKIPRPYGGIDKWCSMPRQTIIFPPKHFSNRFNRSKRCTTQSLSTSLSPQTKPTSQNAFRPDPPLRHERCSSCRCTSSIPCSSPTSPHILLDIILTTISVRRRSNHYPSPLLRNRHSPNLSLIRRGSRLWLPSSLLEQGLIPPTSLWIILANSPSTI